MLGRRHESKIARERHDEGRESTSTVAQKRARRHNQPDDDGRSTKKRKTESAPGLARQRGRNDSAEAYLLKMEPLEHPSGDMMQQRVEDPAVPFLGTQALSPATVGDSIDGAPRQTAWGDDTAHRRRAPRHTGSAQDPVTLYTRLGVGSCDVTPPQRAQEHLDGHEPQRGPTETSRTPPAWGYNNEDRSQAGARPNWKATVGIAYSPVPSQNPVVPPVPTVVRPAVPRHEFYVIFKHSNGVEDMLPIRQSFSALTLTDIFTAVRQQARVDLNRTDTEGILYTLEGPGISGGDRLCCLQRRFGPQRSWFNDLELIKGRMMERVNAAVKRYTATEKSILQYYLIVQAYGVTSVAWVTQGVRGIPTVARYCRCSSALTTQSL